MVCNIIFVAKFLANLIAETLKRFHVLSLPHEKRGFI